MPSRAFRATLVASAIAGATAAFIGWPGHSATIAGPADPVLVGAGDIASCLSAGDEATADLLDNISDTVATFGDNVYNVGSPDEFTNCYEPTWGRHKARTRPAPGNHDYATLNATGYFAYFGAAAGDPTRGYYSYDLGDWHIVVVNSNCAFIGGCGAGSPQEQWLRADLGANPAACTLAYWHHPRFSSGPHGNDPSLGPIWLALYDYGADVVLNGHDHAYERFAPQDPNGATDPGRGIREFVVGTGGFSHYPITTPIANSQVQNDDTFGVLKLVLHSASYDWEFVPVAGGTFTDAGSDSCVTPEVGGIAELPGLAGYGRSTRSAAATALPAGVALAALLAALGTGWWAFRRRR